MRVSHFIVALNTYLVTLHLAIFGVQANTGDGCQLKSSGSPGHCSLLKDCPGALEKIREDINPPICSFQGFEPIICCSGNGSTTVAPTLQEKNERISRIKCAEYGQSVYTLVQAISLIPEAKSQYVKVDTCPDVHVILIIRGIQALPKEYPHMALIGVEKDKFIEWRCPGSLISDQYILTTASCARETRLGTISTIRLGELESISTSKPEDFKITEIILHPEYKFPALYNDIALIKLGKPVRFNENIRPACLPNPEQINNKTKFLLSGWNFITKDLLRDRREAPKSNEECKENLPSRFFPNGMNETTQFCASSFTGNLDVCSISAGSPLQIFDTDVYCMFEVNGLLAYRNTVCGAQIYTNVSEFVDWIEKIVWT